MSLNKTIQEALSNLTSLKRIRLKVDPKDNTLADFTKLNGYEGYILEEHPEDDTIDVYVTTDDQPECMDDHIFTSVPSSCIDIMGSLSTLEKFKLALVTYFKSRAMMPTELLQELVLAHNIKECRCCLDKLDQEGYVIVLTNFLDLLEDQ